MGSPPAVRADHAALDPLTRKPAAWPAGARTGRRHLGADGRSTSDARTPIERALCHDREGGDPHGRATIAALASLVKRNTADAIGSDTLPTTSEPAVVIQLETR
jgi:hypothetical protein